MVQRAQYRGCIILVVCWTKEIYGWSNTIFNNLLLTCVSRLTWLITESEKNPILALITGQFTERSVVSSMAGLTTVSVAHIAFVQLRILVQCILESMV